MKITLRDIANEAAVSEGTASLALNNRPGVKPETRQRVLEIAQRCGYQPSMNAKTLSQKRSHLVGLLIPNIRNLFYAYIVQEIETALRACGCKMILATTSSNEAYEKEMIEQFVSFRVDGVILYPIIKDNHNPHYLDILEKNGIPLVFLGGYYPTIQAPYCMSDLYTAFSELAEHMMAHGCTKFKYFGGCKTIMSNQIKMKALTDTLARHGLVFSDEDYVTMAHTNYDCAYEATRSLINHNFRFDAAITGDAYSGFGVHNALTGLGYTLPHDVAIAYADNLIKPSICIAPMTCIEQDVPGIVSGTLDILNRCIEGETMPQNLLIPGRVIIRASTLR